MMIDLWAIRHGIPVHALNELKAMMGIGDDAPPITVDGKPGSESRQQNLVRLASPKYGFWLTRNNVGALLDKSGRPVRFGLANESPAQNKTFKSHDLIGWCQKTIEQRHVGTVIAQFASIEMKEEGWTFNPADDHEVAQLKFGNFVNANGGFATFATGPDVFTNGAWK